MQTVEGKDVTIIFDGKRCIHSRRCVMGQPAVFRANVDGPWIYPDEASAEDLLRVAYDCPSGAIRVIPKSGEQETAPPANMVIVRENGPLAFHADLKIEGQDGEMTRATLCRCGLSKNKPYLRQFPHRRRVCCNGRAAVARQHAGDHRSGGRSEGHAD
jgi:uncharacterized Fe-S cluster protein YjdI/CDGSH-type Zn-finger protein